MPFTRVSLLWKRCEYFQLRLEMFVECFRVLLFDLHGYTTDLNLIKFETIDKLRGSMGNTISLDEILYE